MESLANSPTACGVASEEDLMHPYYIGNVRVRRPMRICRIQCDIFTGDFSRITWFVFPITHIEHAPARLGNRFALVADIVH